MANDKGRMTNQCRMTNDQWATTFRGSAPVSSSVMRHSPLVIRHWPLALLLAALCASWAFCAAPPVEDRVDEILSKVRRPAPDEIWAAQRQLAGLGAEAVPALKSRLGVSSTRPPARIAIARALCSLGQPADTVEPLVELIRSKRSPECAIAAATSLGEGARDVPATEEQLLRLAADTSLEPDVARAVARSLYYAATTEEGLKRANAALRRLLAAATDPATRADCALSLAEINDFNPPVDAILKDLQDEPSTRGRLARSLVENSALRGLLLKPQNREGGGLNDVILNEVKELIQRCHVEEPLADHELVNAAAKGMAVALTHGDHPDRHSSFFDEKELPRFREHLSGHYAGIGAVVQFVKHYDMGDEPVFTAVRPNYHGPAYKAGIRSYDRILETNGQPTAGRKLKDIVDSLRGEPKTTVELTVTRPGATEKKKVTVQRADIDLPTVHYQLLPGKIGYVQLTSFIEASSRDLDKALRDLERRGMAALVFDLRNNPGGQLSTAVEIASMFLKDNKLVVYTEGRNRQIAPREEYRTRDPGSYPGISSHPGYPMVVLVNSQSASASEIVAGALQDHRRAILLGVRTYGKGSVQKIFPLRATAGQSALKLTIAKYYLPSGRSIHGKGVEPDIEVPFEPTLTFKEFDHLRENGAFYRYTDSRFAQRRDLFTQLAEFDACDPTRYPDFDAWYQGMAEQMGRDKTRRLLRAWLRVLVADDRGTDFVCDIQEDNQLQQAILQAARQVPGLDTKAIPEYRNLTLAPARKPTPGPAEEAKPDENEE